MVTYKWNCKTVDVYPQEEGEADVVYNVHWILTASSTQQKPDSGGMPYTASSIGTQILSLNKSSTFIPFEDLTNEIVVEWTKAAIGEEQVAALELSLEKEIAAIITPTSIVRTIGE